MESGMGRRTGPLLASLRSALAVAIVAVSASAAFVLPANAQRATPQAAPPAQSTAYALVGSVGLPSGAAYSVAISNDDTVYAPTSGSNYVGIINPGRVSGPIDDSVAATFPTSVAVRSDDTFYVMEYTTKTISAFRPSKASVGSLVVSGFYSELSIGGDDTLVATSGPPISADFIRTRGLAVASTTATASNTESGAFDSQKRFVTGLNGNGLATFAPNGLSVSSTILTPGLRPIDTVINSDDTRYVAMYELTGQVRVASANGASFAYSVPVNGYPRALALTGSGDVMVASYLAGTLQLIGRNASTSDTVITGLTSPTGLAVASTGLIYVSQSGVARVAVAAPVSAALASSTGASGSTLGINITGLPAGSLMDDSTVKAVWWGDDTVAITRTPGSNAVGLTVPAGTGSKAVVVQLNGGNAVTAGTFVYATPPPAPTPPVPATPPLATVATAGDASASVSWAAPASSGSYPVSFYQAASSPSGRTCLVAAPALTCEVAGLSNGTPYTFTVKALTGAGWSAASEPSNTVTPQAVPRPTIRITGTREGKRIVVTGTTTGFGMGAELVGWVRLPGGEFERQPGRILVNTEGAFTWERRTRRPATVYVSTPDGSVTSNRVVIPAR